MIIYQATKGKFLSDILTNNIDGIISEQFFKKLGQKFNKSQILALRNSLQYMNNVLLDTEIPEDAGISIEYQLPQTSKRIDFIITGKDKSNIECAIFIELKQWEHADLTNKDGIVITRFEHGEAETPHPSYQVWSYATLLKGYNETVYEEKIELIPCAFLHNYSQDNIIDHEFYKEYIKLAPLFLKDDLLKLRTFIKHYIKYGDENNIINRIDNGKIKPSKALADSISKMLKGNQEFIMIDDQKVVFETALAVSKQASEKNKQVLIVKGGPGTGKSVVAINLLVALTKLGLNSQYVTKNVAPRTVYESKLTGTIKKSEISYLFRSSATYFDRKPNEFDVLIVDEAHRLNEMSGMFRNLGENQIKEIINAGKCSIFFIDEDQRVTLQDIGEVEEIKKWAKRLGAKVELGDFPHNLDVMALTDI